MARSARWASPRLTYHHGFPDATGQAHRNGWFHSGNLAEVDADGYPYDRGRAKDSMRRLGDDISAWDLEVAGLREVVAVPTLLRRGDAHSAVQAICEPAGVRGRA